MESGTIHKHTRQEKQKGVFLKTKKINPSSIDFIEELESMLQSKCLTLTHPSFQNAHIIHNHSPETFSFTTLTRTHIYMYTQIHDQGYHILRLNLDMSDN